MKYLGGFRVRSILVAIAIVRLSFQSGAQTVTNLSQIEGLQSVSPEAIPQMGTFWSWQKQGTEPPLPFSPFPLLPHYAEDTNTFIYDDSAVNYVTLREDAAAHLALQNAETRLGLDTPVIPELGIYGDFSSGMALMESDGPPSFDDVEEGSGGGGTNSQAAAYDYPSNALWLEITGVTNGQANLIVHGTVPDMIYEILSRITLTNVPWTSEGTIIGAPEQDWTPTTIPVGLRTNTLFLWARSWMDTDGDGLPDWWQLQFFGHLGVDPFGDQDGDGWSNLSEYENGTNPNAFNTPPTPQNFTVLYYPTNDSVVVSWAASQGPVTGYTIERGLYDFRPGYSWQITNITVSATADNLMDFPSFPPPDVHYSHGAEIHTRTTIASKQIMPEGIPDGATKGRCTTVEALPMGWCGVEPMAKFIYQSPQFPAAPLHFACFAWTRQFPLANRIS